MWCRRIHLNDMTVVGCVCVFLSLEDQRNYTDTRNTRAQSNPRVSPIFLMVNGIINKSYCFSFISFPIENWFLVMKFTRGLSEMRTSN